LIHISANKTEPDVNIEATVVGEQGGFAWYDGLVIFFLRKLD